MDVKLNERVAYALGWVKRENGVWLNTHGAPVSMLPNFSGDKTYTGVVVRHFDSLEQRIKGNKQAFFSRYSEELSPLEVCNLALEILVKKQDD